MTKPSSFHIAMSLSEVTPERGLGELADVPEVPQAPAQRLRMGEKSGWLALGSLLPHVEICGSALGNAKLFLLPLFT